MPRRQLLTTTAAWLLAAYAVLLAYMLLAPSSAAPSWLVAETSELGQAAGLPGLLVDPERVEFLLNVAAFAPVSLLGSLVWPALDWRDWTALGFVGAFAVEVVQALLLDGRSATHSDVVANTLGALVGAAVATLALRRHR